MTLAAIPMNQARKAFTLVELIVIIVVLAILSGVAIPKYIDYTARAKESSARATLGSVRSAISNFYANRALTGAAGWPTLAQIQAAGTVMQEAIPANPYNSGTNIRAANWANTPPVSGNAGFAYDAASGKFWLNSNTSGINERLW